MQEIHDYSMIGGGGGVSGGIGGDRRMRTHQNNILNHHHQSLKCPRCNSLNTKFCYYNNYNLSQPRHFCKNCRRYWTKGGVLRNVPVGGGCRKAKRSKSKSASSADKTVTQDVEEKSSSSESSSLTASVAAVAGTEAASSVITDIPNLNLYGNGIEWSTLLGQGSSDGGVSSEIGGLSIETATFGFGGNCINQDDHIGDRTAQIDFTGRSSDPNMGFEPLDWGSGGGGDQTLFDLTSTVDHAYWSQTQWTTSSDHDQNGLYLP